MKINRNSFFYTTIFIALCLENQVLYLVPSNWNVLGFDYQAICAIFELMLFVFTLVKFRFHLIWNRYCYIFGTGLLVCFTSAMAATFTYGQDFFTGLIVQRTRIATMLFFFTIYLWYKNKKITIDGLFKLLLFFGIIYGTICCIQYLLSDYVTFTYSSTTQRYRFGSVRYWFSGAYLVLLSGFALDSLWSKKRKKLIDVISFCLPFVLAFVITKTRMMALALCTAVVISRSIHSGSFKQQVFKLLGCFTLAGIFLSSNVGSDIVNSIFTGTSGEDTLTVRNIGRDYYIQSTISSPLRFLFGCGYASSSNPTAYEMTYPKIQSSTYGYDIMLYPQDNGIFGQFYYYGFIGILWWICSLIFLLTQAFKVYKANGNTCFIQFIIYEFVSSISLTPSLFSRYIIFPLLAILLIGYQQRLISKTTNSVRRSS